MTTALEPDDLLVGAESLRLGLILGSTREGRFCETVAAWTAKQVGVDGRFELDVIDPMAVGSPVSRDLGNDDDRVAFAGRLAAADAFIVVTPEYNHSYPGALKILIDSFKREWQAKPVAFVSYGGVSGGLRAVEHLRQVFAELHAVSIRDTVSFAFAWRRFGGDGQLIRPEGGDEAMAALLSNLSWWGLLLRGARRPNVDGVPA